MPYGCKRRRYGGIKFRFIYDEIGFTIVGKEIQVQKFDGIGISRWIPFQRRRNRKERVFVYLNPTSILALALKCKFNRTIFICLDIDCLNANIDPIFQYIII